MLSSREPFFAQQPLNQYPRCMATHVLFATFNGDVDFHVQEQQVTASAEATDLCGSCVVFATFLSCKAVGTMIETVDPLSEESVYVFAVRECASAGARLSTVLVGGRLLKNFANIRHAQADIFPRDHFFFLSSSRCVRNIALFLGFGHQVLGSSARALSSWSPC